MKPVICFCAVVFGLAISCAQAAPGAPAGGDEEREAAGLAAHFGEGRQAGSSANPFNLQAASLTAGKASGNMAALPRTGVLPYPTYYDMKNMRVAALRADAKEKLILSIGSAVVGFAAICVAAFSSIPGTVAAMVAVLGAVALLWGVIFGVTAYRRYIAANLITSWL
ncbi:MAG: hypothetical protein HYT79_02185 [Elusimicrobia bacterium]|nr:hypothetical protein [Elusimicrobiota bacterium]